MAKKGGLTVHANGPHIKAEGKFLEMLVAHCAKEEITLNEWARMADMEIKTLKLLIERKQRLTLYALWRLSTAIGLAPFTKFRAAREDEMYERVDQVRGRGKPKTKAKPVAKLVEQRVNADKVPPHISKETGKPKLAPRGIQVKRKREAEEQMEAMIYAGTEIVPEMKAMPQISATRPDDYQSMPKPVDEEPTAADLPVAKPAVQEAKPEWKPMPKEEARAQTEQARETRGVDITGSLLDKFMTDRNQNKDRKFAR